MSKICFQCGREINAVAVFCPVCGAAQGQTQGVKQPNNRRIVIGIALAIGFIFISVILVEILSAYREKERVYETADGYMNALCTGDLDEMGKYSEQDAIFLNDPERMLPVFFEASDDFKEMEPYINHDHLIEFLMDTIPVLCRQSVRSYSISKDAIMMSTDTAEVMVTVDGVTEESLEASYDEIGDEVDELLGDYIVDYISSKSIVEAMMMSEEDVYREVANDLVELLMPELEKAWEMADSEKNTWDLRLYKQNGVWRVDGFTSGVLYEMMNDQL